MLKHLPERYLPDPERWFSSSGGPGRVEGTLLLALGTVGLSLAAALVSGWLPTDAMASALSGRFPALLTFLTGAVVSLWWGYVLWRSRALDEGWEQGGRTWLWGWGVAVQLAMGVGFLVLVAATLLGAVGG